MLVVDCTNNQATPNENTFNEKYSLYKRIKFDIIALNDYNF